MLFPARPWLRPNTRSSANSVQPAYAWGKFAFPGSPISVQTSTLCRCSPTTNCAAGSPGRSWGKSYRANLPDEARFSIRTSPPATGTTGPGFARCPVRHAARPAASKRPIPDRTDSAKASDYSCIPLCVEHHRAGNDALDKIGRTAFEERLGLNIAALVNRFNQLWHNANRLGA